MIKLVKEMDEYRIRTFERGDEIALVNLFNRTYQDFAGFVPRTAEYWVWCCLSRPGVNEGSIAIVNRDKKIVGYAVVGESGDVWELCYDSEHNGKIIVSKLLNWVLEHARKTGSYSVVLNAPVTDEVVRQECQKLDFAETLPEYTFVSVLDVPSLIGEILRSRMKMSDIDGVFKFRLRNCPSWCSDSFSIKLRGNEFSILGDAIDKPEVVITADMDSLISCIFGTQSIFKAFLTLKVHPSPFWKIRKSFRLFSLLRIGSRWFLPRADLG